MKVSRCICIRKQCITEHHKTQQLMTMSSYHCLLVLVLLGCSGFSYVHTFAYSQLHVGNVSVDLHWALPGMRGSVGYKQDWNGFCWEDLSLVVSPSPTG